MTAVLQASVRLAARRRSRPLAASKHDQAAVSEFRGGDRWGMCAAGGNIEMILDSTRFSDLVQGY